MALTLGSLFAGIGGFDLGFERAGVRTVWQCEIDKAAQGVLRKWFPGAALHSDVCQVGAHNLEPVDVVTFGSPCQNLSLAGKRAGLAGAQSGLFFEAVRIIRELRERHGKPDFAVWENVPGAFSSNGGKDFEAVVQAMVDLGARDVCWRVLDSRYFGVAQRRRRVFLVADFGGERAQQVLFEPESLRGDSKKGGAKRKEAARGAGAGAASGGGEWPARLSATLDTSFGDKMGLENQHVNAGCPNFVPAQPMPMVNMQGSKGNAVAQADGPSYTLQAMHGHDVHAVAVPAQPIPFDTTQLTSPSNYSSPKPGDPCHPLAAGAHPPAVAFEPRYYTRDNKTGGAPTQTPSLSASAWKAGDAAPAVAFAPLQGGRSKPVTAESPTLEAGTRGQAVEPKTFAFDGFQSAAPKATVQFRVEETAPLISTRPHCVGPMEPIAFHPTQDPISSEDGVTHAMSSGNRQGCGTPITVKPPMQVRRLTPTECERLQGFPDEWTSEAALPDGTLKPQADVPRYKQLGNAVTVNVAEWLARRLVAAVGVE